MKSRKTKLVVLFLVVAGVVAWSPPSADDINMGSNNTLDSPSGYLAVIGNSNKIKGNSTLVVGTNNGSSLLGITYANTTLISGDSNTVFGATSSTPSWHSAAIGWGNQIMASPAWTIGQTNEVAGQYGIALGTLNNVSAQYGTALGRGLDVAKDNAVALGRWNTAISPEDVVVFGCGTGNARATALRITNNGGVILERAQGDISMGAYSN